MIDLVINEWALMAQAATHKRQGWPEGTDGSHSRLETKEGGRESESRDQPGACY